MTALHALSLVDAARRLADGSLTARAYAAALLERVAATDDGIGAWTYLDPDRIARVAAGVDRIPPAKRGRLHGIPIGLKDIVHTRDQPTRMGSPAFDAREGGDDAACVRRLHAAGSYGFGKTVTTELAYLTPGKTRNPWNPRHTPGGSSQGSAAAVAAGHVPAALGTQTNGSVIRPATFCGVVGFKPTVGAIPFDGVNVFSRTLDTLGTFTRHVADARRLAAALGAAVDSGALPSAPRRAPRLAFLADFPWRRVDADTSSRLAATMTTLAAAGATITPVALPEALHAAYDVQRTIMLHEASVELCALQARARTLLSRALNEALDEGRAFAADDYRRALAGRATMIAAANDWMDPYDAVVAPPAPGSAPEGLDKTGDPACCTLASLLGAPALALPTGLDRLGLPVGLQLFSKPGSDGRLLDVAAWCEETLPFRGLV